MADERTSTLMRRARPRYAGYRPEVLADAAATWSDLEDLKVHPSMVQRPRAAQLVGADVLVGPAAREDDRDRRRCARLEVPGNPAQRPDVPRAQTR